MKDNKYQKGNSTFGCVLRGEANHLEKIKKHIIREYVKKRLVKLTKSAYDSKGIYIVTSKEWKEYQRLKKYKEEGLIGPGFP